MKIIVSLDNPNHPGWLKLEESLKRHGWEYVTIVKEWKGFGTKIIGLYEHLVNDYDDDFIYLDAYDNYCIAPPDEFNYKHRGGTGLIISAEKGCYPDSHNMGKFPSVPHEWKYLNSGQIYGRRDVFMNLFEQNPVQFEDDDQRWYTDRFLERWSSISLDYCNIFQSVAFEVEGDFTLTYNRLYNNKTHTFPMFIHGNGKTDMSKFYLL
jgi:hypothetical protein